MGFLQKIKDVLGIREGLATPGERSVQYEQERYIAEWGSVKERLTLASNSQTNREILYYLAESDEEDSVRLAAARNDTTPLHASPILADDNSEDVRIALAERLVRLLPDFDPERQSQLYAYIVQSLGTLALDEVLKVRKALSTSLKDCACAPPKVALQLAKDVEREVSEPILRACTVLSDDDLISLLETHPGCWVAEAVAVRKSVSEPVSRAVLEREDVNAGKALILNEGAQISEALLSFIVVRARQLPEWHKPLATRSKLPARLAREMAEYVDDHVQKVLEERKDFDQDTKDDIAYVFRRRLDFSAEDAEEVGRTKLQRYIAENLLDEASVCDAIAMQDDEFVRGALAHLTGYTLEDIKRIIGLQRPKPLVSLSWKAGLSMRTALRLQTDFAKVPVKDLLYPKNGTDFPLTEDEMRWQLDFLGVE